MTNSSASLITSPLFYETDQNNNPLAGGKVYSYQAGTLIPLTTYTDATLTVPNTNPVILDEYGKAQIWLGPYTYKLNVTDVNNVQHPDYPVDNLSSIQTTASNAATAVLAALASTAAGQGAALVTDTKNPTGCISRTQHQINSDMIDFTDFGGVGDGLTNNATPMALAEAQSQATSINVPVGTYVLPDATTFAHEYTGPGVWDFGGTLIPQAKKGRFQEVVQRNSTVIGDLNQFRRAIQAGAVNVVIVGDSITEGVFATSYDDCWASLLAEELRRRLPGVTWTFENLSLYGLGLANLENSALLAVTSPTNTQSNTSFSRLKGMNPAYQTDDLSAGIVNGSADLWPSGSTTGLSWQGHVGAVAPDLVIIAMGQNDGTAGYSTVQEASYAATLVAYLKGLAKVPSIAWVTTIQPTRKQATWRANLPAIQSMADCLRGYAQANNYTLIDANRQQLMLRDGQDIVNLAHQPVPAVLGYPSGWSGMVTMPTIAGYVLTWAGAGTIFSANANAQCRDLHLSAQFTPSSTGEAFGLAYRYVGGIGYEAQVNAGFLNIYYNAVGLSPIAITPLVGGTTHTLDVVCAGARHRVYLDGVKLIDIYDFNQMESGAIGIQVNGAGTVTEPSLLAGITRIIGPAIFTEDELLGISNTDYANNPVTKGGDGIHHPSFLGHYAIYYAASLGLIDFAEKAWATPGPPLSVVGVANTGALAATDYVDISFGVSVGQAAMVHGSAGSLGATCSHLYPLVGLTAGQVVSIFLQQNGSTALVTATITVPVAGNYLFQAVGTATYQGSTARHSLTALAFKN